MDNSFCKSEFTVKFKINKLTDFDQVENKKNGKWNEDEV
jgi:hypothetical protein